MKKHNMNEDIAKYSIFQLENGELLRCWWIKDTSDYNHSMVHLHHYVEKQHYENNIEWYKEHGIEQKLILMPNYIHEQLHSIAVNNLSDKEFEKKYKISKWDLIFNKKYSRY